MLLSSRPPVRLYSLDAAKADVDLGNITTGSMYRLAITEIMWGIDAAATDPTVAQWIEVYNEGAALKSTDDLRLLFTTNKRVERDEVTLVGDSGLPTTGAEAEAGAANSVTFTVVDRVSVINRFGVRWDPPGQSGRTSASTDGKHPVKNLVSMYRKRSTNADKTAYTAHDPNSKAGEHRFGDGTDSSQWVASVGRINMAGPFIGTPGMPQQDDDGIATQSKAPASLPGTSVIINEIYNSDTLQWIELHNTGSAAQEVKKWTLHAAYEDADGKRHQQRVFSIPDEGTSIPGGGFLVITNRDPADSVLAGGVDLHDTNNDKFPAGAQQLYIVVNGADDEWMPADDFLLILRDRNDRTNHEGIVDIAGNQFIEQANVSDAWPLKGWKVAIANADINTERIDANDWGGANSSIPRNAGMTYARIEQKTGAQRSEKDHWRKDGAVNGLGYDPNVDMAIAPGTPGYANNARKANPADIMGKVVISEIMYDAGDNGNLTQWIELYNSSFTESAHLNGDWELEIRNIDTDVESYVDAKFTFDGTSVILPNQTILLVSDRSSASDVVSHRVYNLYQKHRNALGLSARKSVLLSSEGFHLELRYKGSVEDVAGNVMLDPRTPGRTVIWALPETGGEMRKSIIRGFGSRAFDGTPDDANDGTMAASWIPAQSVGSYYGHRDDVGSPGHREGSPLPVSLSSFRPVRDKATGAVVITWITESELNNAGFNILRSETKDGVFQVINVKGIVPGHGTTSEKRMYTYTDTTAKSNVVYYYQIEDVSLDGNRTTLRTTHLRGNVSAGGKLTTRWSELKSFGK
ncbi:lamin tail domain-containing protein [Candidatus Poribacteria bacterium]|nr:lamin tail domain-containing protein [Candidatus Poribacteria bacterium]